MSNLIDIYLNSQKKPIAREHNILLITGDGKTLKADLSDFLNFDISFDTCCLGRSIKAVSWPVMHYADIDADNDFWVLDNLEKNNAKVVPETGYILKHTLGSIKGCHIDWDINGCPWPMADVMWHGSSALFAVLIGLKMNYRRIVLAGCPLDSKGHWYFADEEYGPRWTPETYQSWFEFKNTTDSAHVTSMSGYTRTLLGAPTRAWLNYERYLPNKDNSGQVVGAGKNRQPVLA
jgi:hypothetical protein